MTLEWQESDLNFLFCPFSKKSQRESAGAWRPQFLAFLHWTRPSVFFPLPPHRSPLPLDHKRIGFATVVAPSPRHASHFCPLTCCCWGRWGKKCWARPCRDQSLHLCHRAGKQPGMHHFIFRGPQGIVSLCRLFAKCLEVSFGPLHTFSVFVRGNHVKRCCIEFLYQLMSDQMFNPKRSPHQLI